MKLQTWLIPFAGLMAAPIDAGHTQPAPTAASAAPSVAGWDEFVDSLRALPGRMLAKLPEDQRNDPQVQQEVGRLATLATGGSWSPPPPGSWCAWSAPTGPMSAIRP
jgi:hypothetical protein